MGPQTAFDVEEWPELDRLLAEMDKPLAPPPPLLLAEPVEKKKEHSRQHLGSKLVLVGVILMCTSIFLAHLNLILLGLAITIVGLPLSLTQSLED